MSEYLAEFLGTMILIILGCGSNAGLSLKDSKAENSGWLTVAIAWGISVSMAVYAVGHVSGAHLNPAVSLALAYSGSFPWTKVAGYCLAQLLGAIVGACIVCLHYWPHWKKTESRATKLGVFCTAPAIRNLKYNLVSEILATAMFILGVLVIGANRFTEGLNPLVVGLLIIIIGIAMGGTTGFAINPARDLGPRIAHFLLPIPGKGHSDWRYSWVPVLGPALGGLLGALVYQMLFVNS